MAYDEYTADRIRRVLDSKRVPFEEKKMMGGLCFMVDDKMCVGLLSDKETGRARLMARIGKDRYEASLKKPHVQKMTFTGREMKGYVFVEENGMDRDEQLEYWIQLALDFNPQAKSSKRR